MPPDWAVAMAVTVSPSASNIGPRLKMLSMSAKLNDSVVVDMPYNTGGEFVDKAVTVSVNAKLFYTVLSVPMILIVYTPTAATLLVTQVTCSPRGLNVMNEGSSVAGTDVME